MGLDCNTTKQNVRRQNAKVGKGKMKKLTENARRHIGESLTIRWGTSRGVNTYGYTTCSLRNHRGERIAACKGGGYDMRGTVIGDWIARAFPNELLALNPEDMPANSHWEPERARVCLGKCYEDWLKAIHAAIDAEQPDPKQEKFPEDAWTCPKCGGKTAQSRDGKRVNDGRGFGGLTFHDPNYDPGKAVIGKDCSDQTFSGESDGKTVEQAERDGDTVGLERYQAFYSASSKVPTDRHTVPLIDGACGESAVLRILNAIGLTLKKVASTSKLDVYIIGEHKA